jgi:hypothetical protein
MRRAAVWIVLVAAVVLSVTPYQARATNYFWTENNRWTWLYPELQVLTLGEGESLWIGPGANPGEKWLADNVDMTNHGLITWADNNSAMRVGNTSDLTNYALIDLQAAGYFWLYAGGGGWNILTNMPGATLRKSTSGSDVVIGYTNSYADESKFFNYGTLDAQTGRLVYYCPMMYFEDGTRFTGAGSHCIGVSNITHVDGAITVDPEATLEFDSRIPFGNVAPIVGGTAVLHGRASLLAGSLQGSWFFAQDAVLEVPPGTQARVDATLENQGVINLRGNLYSWNTTVNTGVIDFLGDDFRYGRENGGWPTLINEGTILKSAGIGASILGTAGQPDLNFTNADGALIDVQTGSLSIYAGNFQINAGDIHVAEGARLDVQTYWPNPLTNQGTIRGGGAVQALGLQPLVNTGLISPGDSIGTLTVMGNFVQDVPGSLTIALAGPSAGQFDHLAVTGQARLGGTLVVRTVDGFVPLDGSTYEIVSCAERVEEFDGADLELGPNVTGEIVYSPAAVSVLIHSVTAGVSDPPVGGPSAGSGLEPRLSARMLVSGEALFALSLPDPGVVRIGIFDLSGRQVVGFGEAALGAGAHEWRWNGTAEDGCRVRSGMYFARAEICRPSGVTLLRAKLMLAR